MNQGREEMKSQGNPEDMNALKSREYSFKQIMDRSQFVIPEYQRYYSWEKNHFQDLWNDLLNLVSDGYDTNHTHYMGTIICKHQKQIGNQSEKINRYELVDGQQRLATLIILLKTILNHSKDEKPETRKTYIKDSQIESPNVQKLKLQEGNVNDNRVFKAILELEKDPEARTPSQRKLKEAHEFFREKLEKKTQNMDAEKFLEQLQKQINELKFMVYNIETDEKATLIFESINDRGKGLTRLEKTKSFLMHRTYLCTSDEQSREQRIEHIKTDFSKVYTSIEKINNTELIDRLDEDKIQAYQFISRIPQEAIQNRQKTSSRKEAAEEYLKILKQWFRQGPETENQEEWNKIKKYSADLAEFFQTYRKLLDGTIKIEADTRNQILAGEASYFLPLIIRAEHVTESGEFQHFIEVVDAAAFRTHHDNKRVDRGENKYYRMAKKLHDNTEDLEQIIEQIKKTARLQ